MLIKGISYIVYPVLFAILLVMSYKLQLCWKSENMWERV